MSLNQNHKNWLINRGITEEILNDFDISSAYNRIVIPIRDQNGIILFNKYRRDPEEIEGPKYTYDTGATVKLFNIRILPTLQYLGATEVKKVIICEGELDALCLIAHGYNAVTSTGGAQSFQRDWIPFFVGVEVFVCLDHDKAGEQGTMKITQMIPEAKVIPLPDEVGIKDVTDFFRKYDNKMFDALMKVAQIQLTNPVADEKPITKRSKVGTRIQQAKDVPIGNFIKFNSTGKAKCPFHTDKTPSLQRYKNNTWYCFGCGAGRDTIDFIMKRENLNFNEAIDFLLQ